MAGGSMFSGEGIVNPGMCKLSYFCLVRLGTSDFVFWSPKPQAFKIFP